MRKENAFTGYFLFIIAKNGCFNSPYEKNFLRAMQYFGGLARIKVKRT